MNNNIKETYQLNSILDIYEGRKHNQTTASAAQYYINHNTIPDGIVFSDKASPVNGMHKISNAYYYIENNDYDCVDTSTNHLDQRPYSRFYPLLMTDDNKYNENNYKLLSAKDIDFENAYLKYANITHKYNDPIEYHELSINSDGGIEANLKKTYDFIFGREITPYINNSYDLLNIVDFLLNRINCLNFLMDVIKTQKNIVNS